MAYDRRGFELFLQEWKLEETGQLSDHPLTVETELIYPRPRIQRRTHQQAIPPQRGRVMDWSDRAFHRRVLFKELVEGPFSVGVTVRRGSVTRRWSHLIYEMVQEAGEETAEMIGDRLGGPPLAAALEVLAENGLEPFEAEDQQGVIGAGVAEFDSGEEVQREHHRFSLTTPIRIPNPRPEPSPRADREYEPTLKQQGESNGYITLEYSIFDR